MRRARLKAAPATLAAFLVALSFGATAQAVEFKGASEQGKPVLLRAAPDGTPKGLKVFWRAKDCNRAGYGIRTVRTFVVQPMDRSGPGFFADHGQYRVRYSDARARFRIRASGRQVSEGKWKGTFSATAFVKFNNGTDVTCRLREMGWHAEL